MLSLAPPPPAPPVPPGWVLAPGVRLLWRGDGSFQLEHRDGGVVVTGMDRRAVAGLTPLPRGVAGGGRPAPPAGPVAAPDLAALHRLATLGYLRPHHADVDASPRSASPSPGTIEGPGSGRAALRDSRVEVVGATRVTTAVAALLAADGVGTVTVSAPGTVGRRHLLPGGLTAADEGRRFDAAAADVVARSRPSSVAGRPRPGDGADTEAEPDLVVVCLEAPVEPELRALLHRRRRAHLAVHVDAGRAEVGPLVVPGVTSCLGCADRHRLDRDPAWSLLAVQLISGAASAAPPDPALAVRAGVLAAAATVAWLGDDPTAGGTDSGSWELRPDRLHPRRRARRPHPDCACRAAWDADR